MKTLVLFAIALLGLAPFAAAAAPPLVTTSWVADHLKDGNLVVVHVASLRRDYHSGHLPGARYLWVGSLAQATPDMSFELVPLERLRETLRSLGITARSRIVLCGVGGNVSPTARMYLTFEYAGLGDSTSILDGQFDAWKAEGREVSTVAPLVRPSTFEPRPRPGVFVNADCVRDHMQKPGVDIVDARAPNFYNGASAGQPRAGHIPGAKSLYFATLVDSTNRMLPAARLTELFEKAGVKPGDEIATYCHVGQTASTVYLAARMLGYNVHLYDGSFDEWGGRLDLPVVTAPPDSAKK